MRISATNPKATSRLVIGAAVDAGRCFRPMLIVIIPKVVPNEAKRRSTVSIRSYDATFIKPSKNIHAIKETPNKVKV
eukprot:CAMPEP_0197015294 /NCGR_PEP_ID=MMETSP1380-20130617/73663_1 /TAXON_ID=5936 /ORGANISM="Euplotes crassus, Strain CT5" /LENGTH=76 /DNA_ID=CAMNT_0042441103 /DNA_START=134 /DNA_END=364 /DNA_ORIENTATION=-